MPVDLDKLVLAEDGVTVPRVTAQDSVELPVGRRLAPIHLGQDGLNLNRVAIELGFGETAVWLARPDSSIGRCRHGSSILGPV